MAANQLRRFAE